MAGAGARLGHGAELIRQLHLHADAVDIARQIPDHCTGIARVLIDINQQREIAGAVADAILAAFPRVSTIKVTVHKPHAPIAAIFDDVGIVLTRTRQQPSHG